MGNCLITKESDSKGQNANLIKQETEKQATKLVFDAHNINLAVDPKEVAAPNKTTENKNPEKSILH